MEAYAQAALVIVGTIVVPLVVSFVKSEQWTRKAKQYVAIGVAAVIGFLTVLSTQGTAALSNPQAIASALVEVWVTSQVAYLSFWEGREVEQRIASIGVK